MSGLVEDLRGIGRGSWKSGRAAAAIHPVCAKAATAVEERDAEIAAALERSGE